MIFLLFKNILTYITENSEIILSAIFEHIQISLISILLALIIAIPLGIVSSSSIMLQKYFVNIFSSLRVIPSLAILFICIPLLGIGMLPAIIALTILAIPPILINTLEGFKNIPDSIIESAIGMGMDKRTLFLKIKLPLALPLIITGTRISSVEVIASATLAAYIGAGGLGTIIMTGLSLYRIDILVVGGILVAIFSLLFDTLFFIVENRVTRFRKTT